MNTIINLINKINNKENNTMDLVRMYGYHINHNTYTIMCNNVPTKHMVESASQAQHLVDHMNKQGTGVWHFIAPHTTKAAA